MFVWPGPEENVCQINIIETLRGESLLTPPAPPACCPLPSIPVTVHLFQVTKESSAAASSSTSTSSSTVSSWRVVFASNIGDLPLMTVQVRLYPGHPGHDAPVTLFAAQFCRNSTMFEVRLRVCFVVNRLLITHAISPSCLVATGEWTPSLCPLCFLWSPEDYFAAGCIR